MNQSCFDIKKKLDSLFIWKMYIYVFSSIGDG